MADKYKVGVEVSVDSKGADKNVNSFKASIEKVQKTIKSADSSVNSFAKSVGNLGKGMQQFGKNFSLYVSTPIAGFAALAVKEFMNTEKELNKLNIALQNSGNYSQAAVLQFKALADELSRTTNFSGGAVTMASAMALNFTKTTAEAERLVRAATDLSEATGVGLDQAIQSLGMSLSGVSGTLARTLPQVRNLTEEQLKAGEAIRIVEQRFSGSALNATKNLSGEITRLKNGFLDFASDIGQQLSPYLREFVSLLNDALSYLRSLDPVVRNTAIGIGLFAAAIGPMAVALGAAAKAFPIFVKGLGVLRVAVGRVVAVFLGPVGLVLAIAGAINLFLDLKNMTQSTGKALFLTWQWVGAQFYNIFVIPLVSGLQQVLEVMAKIPGAIGRGFQASADFVGQIKDGMKANTASMTAEVDKLFEGTGKSAASSFTFGFTDVIADLKDRIKNSFTTPIVEEMKFVNKKIQSEVKEISKFQKELAKGIADNVVGNFTNAFGEITAGTKSVSSAFGDMVTSIIQDLSRLVLQKTLTNALTNLFPSYLGSAQGAATGGYVDNGVITHRYAQGGMVKGPGTGTSDSITAKLSNGEFVSDAKTVAHFGADFFLSLKHMARSFSSPSPILNRIPAFANGGLVGGAGSGDTRVVIQNSGSPKEATSVTTEQDAQGMVVNIILEDIQKNGNISKSLQTNYGLKRGGL